jgi:carbamoyltransferase
LWAYNTLLGKPRSFTMQNAYWGKSYSAAETADFLNQNNIPFRQFNNEDQLLDVVAEQLTQGKVLGWFQGRFEWGPRALGNRSILADPRNPEMKDIVNTKIKFREPYRPFAPSVLSEYAQRYFDFPDAQRHYPARFMLYVAPVKVSEQKTLPAITHVDGTGRLQTVFQDQNPLYYRLIERFGQATGVPVVLNTSFNLRGEPIVTTPANAFNTFSKSEMDSLVLGNFLVEKLA